MSRSFSLPWQQPSVLELQNLLDKKYKNWSCWSLKRVKLDVEFKASTNTTDWNTFKSTVNLKFVIFSENRERQCGIYLLNGALCLYMIWRDEAKKASLDKQGAMAKMETLSTTNQLLFHGAHPRALNLPVGILLPTRWCYHCQVGMLSLPGWDVSLLFLETPGIANDNGRQWFHRFHRLTSHHLPFTPILALRMEAWSLVISHLRSLQGKSPPTKKNKFSIGIEW